MRIRDGCVARPEEFGLLIRAPNGNHYALNKTATLLWERLSHGDTSADELVTMLVRRFNIDVRVARSDVKSLLRSLGEYGLIVDWEEYYEELEDSAVDSDHGIPAGGHQ